MQLNLKFHKFFPELIISAFFFSACGDNGSDSQSEEPIIPQIDIQTNIGTFTDERDSQVYETVQIGTQTWMAENLKFFVNDVNSDILFKCYNDEVVNCEKYGFLYTRPALSFFQLCPNGWHLPSLDEWKMLINLVGGEQYAGANLKSKEGWSNEADGLDIAGFSVLPAGLFNPHMGYLAINEQSTFWADDEQDGLYCAIGFYTNNSTYMSCHNDGHFGYSVRCIKNFD